MRPLKKIGEDQPSPGIGTFHATFFVALHSLGRLRSVEMPWPVGPRNSGQFSARPAVTNKARHATASAGCSRAATKHNRRARPWNNELLTSLENIARKIQRTPAK